MNLGLYLIKKVKKTVERHTNRIITIQCNLTAVLAQELFQNSNFSFEIEFQNPLDILL